MTLPTDYATAGAHNETNLAVNALDARVAALETAGGGGGGLTLLGQQTGSTLVSWTDTFGHSSSHTLTVAGTSGVPILFQFNVALGWGATTSGQLTVVNDGITGNFVPYHLYHESRAAGNYIERTIWASITPTSTGNVIARLVFQLASTATSGNHELDSHDSVYMRAFG